MRCMRGSSAFVVYAAILVCSVEGTYASLLVRQSQYRPYGYGETNWSATTAAINMATGKQVTVVADFANATQVNSADALWIDLGQVFNGVLSPPEIANIANFIDSGRRVVMFGDNSNWESWNNSILSLVGGTFSSFNTHDVAYTAVNNSLTAGVSTIFVSQGGGEAGVATEGTQLFDQNVATLWNSNVLTILDVNLFSNEWLGGEDNTRFMHNVVDWVTSSPGSVVPEPATLFVWSGLGLAAACSYYAKKKRAHSQA